MKRSQINWTVGLILFVIGLAIALFVVAMVLFGGEGIQELAADTFCSIGARGRAYLHMKGALGVAELTFFPEFCKTRLREIEPDNFELCPHYEKLKESEIKRGLDWKDVKIRQDYYKKCAAEQFARLATKCWKTRGAGKLDPGNYECYSVCIKATGDLSKLEKDLEVAWEDYLKKKDAYDAAVAEQPHYHEEDDRPFTKEEEEEELEDEKKDLEEAKTKYDELDEEYEQADKEKHAVSFNVGFLKDRIKDTNYTKEQKIKDVLNPSYVRTIGVWENLGVGGRLPWDTGPSDISTGKIISIFFKDDWKTLFGLAKMENDAIVLRYKGDC